MTTLRDIGEDALIEHLIGLVPLDDARDARPGDDCAVVECSPDSPELQLLKTDALVENIHFLPSAESRAVGWKAIARVVSDMAAMGGRPKHVLVTLAMPSTTPVSWVEELYAGMSECLTTFHAVLAGGETTSVPVGSAIVISIAATGTVSRSRLTLRRTGRPGDVLLVTGELGGSIMEKHLNFTPRIAQAEWLTEAYLPSAMMDLSDGLAKDLPRLARASGCGYRLDLEKIPRTPGCAIAHALGDGEDYELLICMAADRVEPLLVAWQAIFPNLALTCIGELTDEMESTPLSGGWEHF